MGGHDVVILGFRLNGPEAPAKALERLLRVSAGDARAMAKRFPCMAGADLAEAEAEALADQLRAVGARVEVRSRTKQPAQPEREPIADLGRAPMEPPAPVNPVAHIRLPEAPAAPVAETFQLGPLRLSVPGKARESLAGKYLLGTLRILLPQGGPPPPAAQAPGVAPPVAELPQPGASDLYETGMRDDVLGGLGEGAALELDEAARDGARYVSGGRAQRPSLMMRVGKSLADMPSNLVRRRVAGPGRSRFRGIRRSQLLVPSLGGGVLALLAWLLFGALAQSDGARVEAQQGSAMGEPARAMVGAAERSGESTERPSAELHPMLKLAPEAMQGSLAAILRKQVKGVSSVAIDWPEGQEPKPTVRCMLVAGTSNERAERVRALLATGKSVEITPMMANQLRDHAEVLRTVSGESNAHHTPLCLTN
jgi:hypothetical protein